MNMQEVQETYPDIPRELFRMMAILDAVYEYLSWEVEKRGQNKHDMRWSAYASSNLTEISLDWGD